MCTRQRWFRNIDKADIVWLPFESWVRYGKYADVLNLFERTYSFYAFWNENIAFNLKIWNCLFKNQALFEDLENYHVPY